jgi:hypothetical protein
MFGKLYIKCNKIDFYPGPASPKIDPMHMYGTTHISGGGGGGGGRAMPKWNPMIWQEQLF